MTLADLVANAVLYFGLGALSHGNVRTAFVIAASVMLGTALVREARDEAW